MTGIVTSGVKSNVPAPLPTACLMLKANPRDEETKLDCDTSVVKLANEPVPYWRKHTHLQYDQEINRVVEKHQH